MTLRIKDWDKHFENNRTRELKRLSWVPFPNTHDGDGYTELLDHKNGVAHFGCWCALCEVASKCDPRGTLLRDGGKPHDCVSLSRMTRIPQRILKEAIERLLNICWLEVYNNPAGECDPSTAEGCGLPEGKGREGKEGKREGIAIPEALNIPLFIEAWDRWNQYRKEIHKPLTPSTIKMQLRDLEAWGVDKAVRALDESIKNQWQGIFDPDKDNSAGKVKATPRKPKPKELFEAAMEVCVDQFRRLIKTRGVTVDRERLILKLKDQYRGMLVFEDHTGKQFLIQDAEEIAKRQMGDK